MNIELRSLQQQRSVEAMERAKLEQNLQISNEFLRIANRHNAMGPLLTEFVEKIKAVTSCKAVGIRLLDEEGNIPYEAYDGFSRQFYESESPLSIHSDQCMCISVVKNVTDPELPFFTENGSFYINGTTRFLATRVEEEKGQTRNMCNKAGYESIALVPIRLGKNTLGLIHFADPDENKVPIEVVKIMEKVVIQLGSALQRIKNREELQKAHDKLEKRVRQRTSELVAVNERLRQEIKERRSKEKELIKSESKFRLVTETVEDVFWMSTPGVDKMIYISPGYEKLWKRTSKALYESPRSFLESVHPDDRKIFEDVIENYHSRGKAYECEYRIIRADGEIRWIHERGCPVKNQLRYHSLMASICPDITRQKQIVGALYESQFRCTMAEKLARIGYFIRDYDTDTAIWSPGVYRIFGIEPDTTPPNFSQFMDIIHSDDRERLKRKIQHARSTNNSNKTEYRFNHPDGKEKTVRVIIQPFIADNGQSVNLQGTIQDITEEKLAEKKLKESESKYKELFENELIAMMVIDAETLEFEEVNKFALNLYGYSKEEFITLKLLDISAEKDRTKDSVRKIAKGDLTAMSIPLRYHTKRDGETFPAEISARMFHSGDRKKIIVSVHDITERIQFEEALRKNEKRLRRQAQNLEKTNTALSLLLDHRAEEKKQFENNVLNNLKNLVMPFLEKMKKSRAKNELLDYLSIVEKNLNEITSAFSTNLTAN
jgi:PAS domain S-box-containing protein